MKEATSTANMTIIVIILIGVIASVAILVVNNLMKSTTYKSCCTSSGGIWKNGYCAAPVPTSCTDREAVWQAYDQCAIDNNHHQANIYYRAVKCSN